MVDWRDGKAESAVRHADCSGWDGPFLDCSITATELWLSSSRANEYYLIIVQFVLSHVLFSSIGVPLLLLLRRPPRFAPCLHGAVPGGHARSIVLL